MTHRTVAKFGPFIGIVFIVGIGVRPSSMWFLRGISLRIKMHTLLSLCLWALWCANMDRTVVYARDDVKRPVHLTILLM